MAREVKSTEELVAAGSTLTPSMDFVDEIGTSAGIVWRYLEQHGPVTLFQLKKGVELSSTQVERAIGWLAREGKCCEERFGKKVLLNNLL